MIKKNGRQFSQTNRMSYNIPNKTVQAGLHSPIVDISTYLDLPKKVLKWYTEAHIKVSIQTFRHRSSTCGIEALR